MFYQQLHHPTPGRDRAGAEQYGWRQHSDHRRDRHPRVCHTVQYDLGNNGANGLYSAIMGSSGCPSFIQSPAMPAASCSAIRLPAAPYTTGAPMNAGSGTPFVNINTGNQLGRIDITVAPSNSNYIYAQGQSIVGNSNSGCGSAPGCQIGAWATTNGGTNWSFMEGSQGGALRNCTGGAG